MEVKHFVYSDPHFNHCNIIEYGERPFDSIKDMEAELIKRYNELVSPIDIVYILGDFGFGTLENISRILNQMNGYKILIMGNHDMNRKREWWLNAGFNEVSKYPIVVRGKYILSHRPMDIGNSTNLLNVHGHIHKMESPSRFHYNACVEVNDYRPINFKIIEKTFSKRNKSNV